MVEEEKEQELKELGVKDSKLLTPKIEAVHGYDILTLLGVLERKGTFPEEVSRSFSVSEQTDDLNQRIKIGYEHYGEDRLGIFPSERYMSDLKFQLHKFRPIR